MSESTRNLDAADHALREVCKSLLAVTAEDPTIYSVLQDLAAIGHEIAIRKQEALKAAEGEEGRFMGEGI